MQVEALINSYVVEDDTEKARKIAQELAASASLLQVVKALESPLTQEDNLVRAKATKCLTDVVKSNNSLRPQELQVLSVFFSDRLHDFDSVAPAAEGLRSLTTKPGYKQPAEDDEQFWPKLKELDMLHLDLQARYEISLLLQSLSAKPSVAFVDTFVALASGEKDPRNLLVNLKTSLHTLKAIGSSLPVEKRSEIFDITFCYFPIKFNAPKDMPYKITAEDLREALCQTLSHEALAEWAIPGLVSKLTAVNVNVKLDALATLEKSLANLKRNGNLSEYWQPVWEGIRYEVLHGTPENETYKPVIKILSMFVEFPEFLSAVLQELNSESIAKSKLYQICHLIVGISVNANVWNALVPAAIEKCYESPNALNLFLVSNYAIPHQDQVFQALLTFLANGEKRDSLSGLTKFALNPSCSEYVPLIVQTLTQEADYAHLAELSPSHSTAIQEHCLPQLFAQLPQSLDALAQVCCVRPLLQTLCVRLLSRLEFGTNNDNNGQPSATEIFRTLLAASSKLDSNSDFVGFDRALIVPLFDKFRQAASESIHIPDRVTDAACILIERAARGVTTERHDSYISSVTKDIGQVHFHLIVSAMAPMKHFPFEKDFITSYVLPRLKASQQIFERAAYLRLIALTSNKWYEDVEPEFSVTEFSDMLKQKLTSGDNEPCDIETLCWLTKGLVFRNDALGFSDAAFLADLVPHNPLVAKAFGVLVADDRIVAKCNGCTVRPLFRQKMFVTSLPKLSQDGNVTNSLVAISSLLKYTPQAVVSSRFDEILPMLIQSLNINSANLQETALQVIFSSLPQSATSLEPQLDLLIPKFLEISRASRSANARALALKTITALRTALPAEMAGFKTHILDEVELILGDRKREVRQYAVKCRQAFY